ncbi:MAG: DUF2975 domain-containing protein [Ilumatobacteraceae bacterium]
MEKVMLNTLRVVLGFVLAGTAIIQLAMAWTLVSGRDPEDGSASLTALRVLTIVGLAAVQVGAVSAGRIVAMVRGQAVTSQAAHRSLDALSGSIVAVALVWFGVTGVNAPGQRDDPGVTVIMGGLGVGILGLALFVRVLRMLLVQGPAERP